MENWHSMQRTGLQSFIFRGGNPFQKVALLTPHFAAHVGQASETIVQASCHLAEMSIAVWPSGDYGM